MPEPTHVTIAGSNRIPLPGARALGSANPHATLEVLLKLRRKKALPELTGRPSAHLTRDELVASYGASDEDINAVVSAFGQFGLTKVDANSATRSVRLSGTVAELENAFQVKLFNYAHANGSYRGRVGSVHVPVALKDIVQGVFGLDDRNVAGRRGRPVDDAGQPKAGSVPAAWYTPSQLAAHYNFPPGDGSGQAVGLLEFGGGYFPADLQQFCTLAGIAPPEVIPVSTDGTSTSAKDGAEGEVMLDIEVVAGACPKANIVVYFAHWGEKGWITAIDAAVQDKQHNPGVVSVSGGLPEDEATWTPQAMTQVNETLKEAALLGVTVCIAAGDDGSSGAVSDGHVHANFPASSPYVLSVGGTTIPKKNATGPDIVWKEGDGLRADNGGSTGGGVSAVFPRPTWQSGIAITSPNPGAIVGRCLPDIAANADWNASPYLLVVDGGAQGNGGTSAATPLWASLIALINAARGPGKRIGYLTPLLYQPQSGSSGQTIGQAGCTDVESGNNNTAKIGGYSAGKGYDAVSGWGTPNGKNLLAALANH
jgi:kumamolisin